MQKTILYRYGSSRVRIYNDLYKNMHYLSQAQTNVAYRCTNINQIMLIQQGSALLTSYMLLAFIITHTFDPYQAYVPGNACADVVDGDN